MDGWPGWKLAPPSASSDVAESAVVVEQEESITSNKKLMYGLAVGFLIGVAIYFLIVKFLPWWSTVFTIIESN